MIITDVVIIILYSKQTENSMLDSMFPFQLYNEQLFENNSNTYICFVWYFNGNNSFNNIF